MSGGSISSMGCCGAVSSVSGGRSISSMGGGRIARRMGRGRLGRGRHNGDRPSHGASQSTTMKGTLEVDGSDVIERTNSTISTTAKGRSPGPNGFFVSSCTEVGISEISARDGDRTVSLGGTTKTLKMDRVALCNGNSMGIPNKVRRGRDSDGRGVRPDNKHRKDQEDKGNLIWRMH